MEHLKRRTFVSMLLAAPIVAGIKGTAHAAAKSELRFSNPTLILNAYLPLSLLTQDILDGTVDGQFVHVERTMLAGTKAFTVNGQTVNARIMQDRETVNGVLAEVATDYFAQADNGAVCYLGEDVDVYDSSGTTVISHEGAWLFGVNTNVFGILMPAHPEAGQKFESEHVPGLNIERDTILATNRTVMTSAGTFRNCLRIKEVNTEGEIEFKQYAPCIGVLTENDGALEIISHTAALTLP